MSIEVLILGTGCATCHGTEKLVKEVVEENGIDATVELVTDLETILGYGVMHPPGIVIDGHLAHSGGMPSKEKVLKLIEGE